MELGRKERPEEWDFQPKQKMGQEPTPLFCAGKIFKSKSRSLVFLCFSTPWKCLPCRLCQPQLFIMQKKIGTLNYPLSYKILQGFQFFWLSVFLLVMWLARWRALLVAIARLAGIFCVIFTSPKCNCNNEILYLSIILIMPWYKSLVNLRGLSAV